MKAPTVKREVLEEGNYPATLYKIVYMGVVEGEYKGEKTSAYKVNLTWELPTEMKEWKEGEGEKPVVVSKMCTLSMNSKANLRAIVEGMIGGMTDAEAIDYDLDDLAGQACLLNISYGVSETGKEKQNVSTSKLIKGMDKPKPFNKKVIVSYQNWNEAEYQNLPQFMKDEMAKTLEYQIMKGTYVPTADPHIGGYKDEVAPVGNYDGTATNPDDIPF